MQSPPKCTKQLMMQFSHISSDLDLVNRVLVFIGRGVFLRDSLVVKCKYSRTGLIRSPLLERKVRLIRQLAFPCRVIYIEKAATVVTEWPFFTGWPFVTVV